MLLILKHNFCFVVNGTTGGWKQPDLSPSSGISMDEGNAYFPDTRVSISSGDDVHANTGSKVVFKCEIQGTMGKPAYVFW